MSISRVRSSLFSYLENVKKYMANKKQSKKDWKKFENLIIKKNINWARNQ